MANDIFTKLSDQYPFITLCVYASTEYVGIVQNQDATVTTIYDFGSIHDSALKQRFLELANAWWWESNRMLPIDVFLHHEMKPFRNCIRTFVTKDVNILFGPVTSLQNLLRKRIKRRSIQLIRKPD